MSGQLAALIVEAPVLMIQRPTRGRKIRTGGIDGKAMFDGLLAALA